MGRHADGGIDGGCIHGLPGAGAAVEFSQRVLCQSHPLGRTRNGDTVPPAGQPDIKSTFKVQEMPVMIPYKPGQKRIVLKLHGDRAVIRRRAIRGAPAAATTGRVERGLCLFSQALSASSVRTPPRELV
ncbi:hypothetical protein AA0614_2809 [Komagataeibacter saccharivorans NRIC 0614]|nr:hypothetical protein AA0614_2809 [Komagataeibacter saccharivorans NRIC 0614]